MKESPLRLHLVDYLACRAGCEYVSDLHRLDAVQRVRLRYEIERLAPEDARLCEWNDALAYLAGRPPEADAEAAREKILLCLTGAYAHT